MKLHRRAVLAGSLAAGLLPGRLLAQGDDLLRRPIPSSGETVPAIGIGTSRRYDVAPDSDAMTPLRETVAKFVALGGTVIDTAPDYGRAEEVLLPPEAEQVLRRFRDALREQAGGDDDPLRQVLEAVVWGLRSWSETAREVGQLREALESRATIEQAKGIVMARRASTPDDAFRELVRLSNESNVRLADVAKALVYQVQHP